MKKYLISLLLAVFVIPGTVLAKDPPTEVWVKTIGLGGDEWGEDIAVDAAGNVYVTGNSFDGVGYNWLTVKYDSDGNQIWWKPFDTGLGDDIACAVDVDNAGNVYVAGYTPDSAIHDWRYIKYDSDGNLVWNKIRDWGTDVDQGCHDIAVDTLGGHLYMIGNYIGPDDSWDYLTVKCDLDGNYITENAWTGGSSVYSSGRAIALYQVGTIWYIYVTGVFGSSGLSWATIKYDTDLNLEWSAVHNSGSEDHIPAGGAIAVDHAGRAVVVGWAVNATNDWQIVKYSAGGTSLWDKTIDTGYDEGAWGVAVDDAGFIYVNGDFNSGTNWDCRTTKLDGDGNTLWDVTYDYIGDDAGRGVVIDDSGYLYVVGHSYRTTDRDFITIKYEEQSGIAEQPPVGYSSLLSLEVINNSTAIPSLRYTLPAGMQGNLIFYSADGKKIEEFSLSSSQSTFIWNTNKLPCGVYLARLSLGNHSLSTKICLLR